MKALLSFRKPLLLFSFCLPFSFIISYAQSPSSTPYCGKQFRIVILGSSTAFGRGATPIDSSWVNRYTTYVKLKNSQNTVINLAVSGYTTYQVLCPNNFVPPAGRPLPDTMKNITKALSLNPNAIIINLPTNDINYGYS